MICLEPYIITLSPSLSSLSFRNRWQPGITNSPSTSLFYIFTHNSIMATISVSSIAMRTRSSRNLFLIDLTLYKRTFKEPSIVGLSTLFRFPNCLFYLFCQDGTHFNNLQEVCFRVTPAYWPRSAFTPGERSFGCVSQHLQ